MLFGATIIILFFIALTAVVGVFFFLTIKEKRDRKI